ncbi:hypothetical protein [Hoeflea prorocentri]|uniref:Uncharacterized protein n=1 Tax=Hoeflea prorocentri TaxID=1922333 RepID=A0A9X3ZGS1_9HYPH|nr:hypothetical protein [Hoeflea prorocentri]MCY6381072.1 hypothetical protein [Hoeflea prorocentri]MDA5398872.1 hypothetical protein [Hoeflea prorocentri]
MIASRLILFLFAIFAACGYAAADTAKLYDGPLPVKVKDRTVSVPVVLTGEAAGEEAETIILHATARTQDLSPILKEQLQIMADENISACELRLSVPDANVSADGTLLILAATIDAEVWVCTNFLKTKLGGESARITAGVVPTVKDGRIFLEAGELQIEGIGDLITSIGGDRVLQKLYFEAVDRFNRDQSLTSLPSSLSDAGFVYSEARVDTASPTEPKLNVSVSGPNDLAFLAQVIAGLR